MNAFELSHNWFDFCFENPGTVKPVHTAMYFYIIEHCNKLGWKEKFGLPYDMTKEAIGISNYKTYSNTFDDLVNWGFIKLHQKSKNQYTSTIIALVINTNASTKATTEARTKATSKADTKARVKQRPSTVDIDKQYNLETNKPLNHEQKTETAHGAPLDSGLLFEDLKPEIKYPYTSDEFLANWGAWKKYKKEQKKFKWSVESEQAALLKLSKISKTDSEAVEIIQESMANGWAGLFELKNKTNGTEQKSPAEQFAEIYNSDAAKNFRFSPDNNR